VENDSYIFSVVTASLITLIFAIVVIFSLLYMHSKRKNPYTPMYRVPVMTNAELQFFQKLEAACSSLGDYRVFPQVSMGAVIEVDKALDFQTRRSYRSRFDRKIIDFVVCDRNSNVLVLVELDDSTHDAQRDRERDSLTASAGYNTLRMRGKKAFDVNEIKRNLKNTLLLSSS
jgi:hypothetical protein